MANDIEVKNLLSYIKAIWPNFHCNEEIGSLWIKELVYYPDWLLNKAVRNYAGSAKYSPTLADIIEHCQKIDATACRPKTTKATQVSLGFGCEPAFGEVRAKRLLDDGRTYYQNTPEKYAVRIKGEWVMKIDFCMEKLGAKKVTEILKSELKVDPTKPPKLQGFPVKKYLDCLEQLTILAMHEN